MDIPRDDLERLMFFEQTRSQAMAEYKRNPLDADNLTKLGRTLVELSQFAQGAESQAMLDDAVRKLEEAVNVAPTKHDAHWWLGNAHTTQGFNLADAQRASVCFEKAAECFRNAIKHDPTNEAYRKSLEVSLKGPELHQELQKQMALQHAVAAAQPGGGGGGGGVERGGGGRSRARNYELLYDIGGWVILTVGVVAWLSLLSARAAAVK